MKNFDFCTYETLRRYFTSEIEMRNTHFRKYIEMWIDDYFGNVSLTKSFEHEIVWRCWNDFETSVIDFIKRYQDKLPSDDTHPSYYHYHNSFNDFKEHFILWRRQWLNLRRKNKNGEGVEGSSKFQTLVRKVMKEQNFGKRESYFSG